MDEIHTEADRVTFLVAKLENVTNSSAADYMHRLGTYLQSLSMDEKQPFQVDTTAGVVWVATLPILFFLVIFVVLGIIIGYIWYTQSPDSKHIEHSEISNVSRTSSRRNRTYTTAGNSLRDFFYDSKASKDTIGSISKTSMLSCASCRSGVAHKNDKKLISTPRPCLKKAVVNGYHSYSADVLHITLDGLHQYQGNHCTPYKSTLTLSSQSYSTDSYEEGLYRDNLRASMESHRLVRMGNSEIKPDDTYSWSDNTAYTTGMSEKKSIESRHTLRGFRNPVFTPELHHPGRKNTMQNCEDEGQITTDYFQINRQISLETSVINISSVSTSTNYPSPPSNLVPQNSESSLCIQNDLSIKAGMVSRTSGSATIFEANDCVDKVGGSLPPLPPNQFHRLENFVSPNVKRDARLKQQNNSSTLLDSIVSDFDRSSLADSSTDSGTLSLPSSIAKFHASRVQPLTTPKIINGSESSTHKPTTEQNPESSLIDFFKAGSPRRDDGFSICPNIGSFNQSFEGSIPISSFQDTSYEIQAGEQTISVASEDKDARPVFNSGSSPIKNTNDKENGSNMVSPIIIYREGDARLRRLLSLDQLKSGKVSVEQRLRQFGYVKCKADSNIYTNTPLPPEKSSLNGKEETSWNSATSSSDGRIENLTLEMKKHNNVGQILTETGKKIEARPGIVQVLTDANTSSNSLGTRNNLKNTTKCQEGQTKQTEISTEEF